MEAKTDVITAIVVGCGNRGTNYSNYAKEFPENLKIVAVSDPIKLKRERVAKKNGLTNPELIVDDWQKLAKMPGKLADCAIIATQDQMHKEPAIALASKGKKLPIL